MGIDGSKKISPGGREQRWPEKKEKNMFTLECNDVTRRGT